MFTDENSSENFMHIPTGLFLSPQRRLMACGAQNEALKVMVREPHQASGHSPQPGQICPHHRPLLFGGHAILPKCGLMPPSPPWASEPPPCDPEQPEPPKDPVQSTHQGDGGLNRLPISPVLRLAVRSAGRTGRRTQIRAMQAKEPAHSHPVMPK